MIVMLQSPIDRIRRHKATINNGDEAEMGCAGDCFKKNGVHEIMIPVLLADLPRNIRNRAYSCFWTLRLLPSSWAIASSFSSRKRTLRLSMEGLQSV